MTPEEWWTTPFVHKAMVNGGLVDEAVAWLIDQGYIEWCHWNKVYVFENRYRFEFYDEDLCVLFKLRWV